MYRQKSVAKRIINKSAEILLISIVIAVIPALLFSIVMVYISIIGIIIQALATVL